MSRPSNQLGSRAIQIAGRNSGIANSGWMFIEQYVAGGPGELSAETLAGEVEAYLRWLRERYEHIALRGIERSGGAKVVQLPLATAYVPLRARPQAEPGADPMPEAKTRHRALKKRTLLLDDADAAGEDHQDRDVSLNQLLSLGTRLAVIGGPGSGKTTVLLHMAWALAASLLDHSAEPARSRLGLPGEPATWPLPIFVPLASFARYRRSLPDTSPQRSLRHYISHHLISQQAGLHLPADFFERLLRDGRHVLLLLDGLDEVANETERHSVRQQVEDLVRGRDALRTVVTCRTVAYRQGRTALGAAFREVLVQPLDFDAHITPMVQQAYACIHPHDAAQRQRRAEALLTGIQRLEDEREALTRGRDAEPLVASPLMVRLLLIVHENERQLPNQRADLFEKAVYALLQVDYGPDEDNISELKLQWEDLLAMSQTLAWHLHSQGDEQGREIGEDDLRRLLQQDENLAPWAASFMAQARQRGSLVEEREGAYRFVHLALQEFLVARHLREVVAGTDGLAALVAAVRERLTDPWWREPILLALGYRADRNQNPVRQLMGLLRDSGQQAGTGLEAALAAAELAGTAAADWPKSGPALQQACAQRLLGLLSQEPVLLHTPPALRARAGDALCRLGDPRFDPQRFFLPADAHLGFVHIAADPQFRIGTRRQDAERVAQATGDKAYDDELNEAITPSPAFWMARFPVTVAQFRAYVQATGVAPGDPDALSDPDTRPVRHVGWHEASAYAAWLNHQLANAPELADTAAAQLVQQGGWVLSLPSELE